MKNLLTKLRYVPKRFGVVAAVLIAGTTVAMTFAWGPSRTTYTVANPASKIVFNSITDNPNVGDERNFVVVKDAANTASGGWQDNVTVQPGKEYLVRMYVHNNAASSLNLTATNTRVMAALGTNTGTKVDMTGYVSADNASPKEVWDDISFESSDTFNMAYVSGSAKLYNNVTGTAGRTVSDTIMDGSGALVGYNANDGNWPGCFQYAGYVTFKVKPQFASKADFTMSKTVRKSGTTAWSESVATNPGDTVQYRVLYNNTSTSVQQDNVTIRDTLPAGVTYVPGTTNLFLGSDPLTPRKMSDNITTTGINIGSYAAGGMALVIFNAKVAANDALAACGPNTLKNIAKVETDYGTKQDDADVTVIKTCVVKDITVCELSTKKIITIKEDAFDATKHSRNLDDCKVIVKDIQVCELSTKKIITIKENMFDATKHSKNLDDCKVVEVKDIQVCRLSDKTIITIKETDFDATKHSKNLEDCKTIEVKNIEVCELSTKKIITIKETDFDAVKHSKNLDDCKTLEAKFIKVCVLADKTITTINEKDFDATKHSKDLAVCKEVTPPVTPPVTPETPETLPSTGPATLLSGLFGSSALGLGISSFVRSRRALRDSMNR